MKLVTLFATSIVATLSLCAAPTQCGNAVYFANEAPDILNTKLTAKTKELCYSAFAVMHSGVARSPLWSAEHLYGIKLGTKVDRTNDFHPEERLSSDERSELSDYAHSGYDRGHMAPARDFNTLQSESECFTLANMVPENSENNRGIWADIEGATRELAKIKNELYVITGPLFIGSNIQRLNGRVFIPTKIYKAIYDPSSGQGAAYLVDNAPGRDYKVVSIAQIEQLAGIRLFPKMSASAKQTPMILPPPQTHGSNDAKAIVPNIQVAAKTPSSSAQCGSKHSCKEMSSCDEARYFLTQCSESHLDGDGDGTPCEKLCRGRK